MSMAISGMGGAAKPQAMSGASMRTPPTQKMSTLFDKIDTSGSGKITKAQFEQAFQNLKSPQSAKAAGADAIFAKLDPNGTGSVSKQDFVNGMKAMMTHGHHHGGGNVAPSTAQAASTPTQTLSSGLDALNSLGKSPTSGSLLNTSA